jgi:Trk-type K+ transport system membrane component
MIDFLAIVPFDVILNASQFNSLARVARVGRLYKLVKLSRLFRFIKVWKNKNKIIKQLTEFLKIGLGFERLFFFVLIFVIGIHLAACFWLITASMLGKEPDEEHTDTNKTLSHFQGTWLEKYDHKNLDNGDLYAIAIYWAVQTITTVGYGDISSENTTERIFCALMMVIGVIAFSFANGSLTSLIQNYDVQNAEYVI